MWCKKIILHINSRINKKLTNKKREEETWEKINIQLIRIERKRNLKIKIKKKPN